MAVQSFLAEEEVLDFLMSQPTSEQIIAFRASEAVQERVRDLLDKNRNERLTDSEAAEIEAIDRMQHLMRKLKIRARQRMAQYDPHP